jgi:bla regulator protein blaR1
MPPALFNHLWQSTLFAGVAGVLTLTLRKNHARVRHWVWLAASCKFLIPLSVLIALGSHIHWRTAPQIAQSNLTLVLDEVSQPFTAPAVSWPLLAAAPRTANPVPAVLFSIWACGFLGIAFAWRIRWLRILAAVRTGSLMHLKTPIRAITSPTLLEPGVFGVFRSVLLLPEGVVESLTPAQLEAVIAHELCHVRHRDNLIAAIHMFVETLFWFHPLVWWIGKRMVAERELACDEEVLLLGADRRVYAEGILNVCKLYMESPLPCVSGVTGSNLKKRIEAIMSNRFALRLTFAKRAVLAVAGVSVLAAPIVVGMLDAPPIRAQSPRTAAQSAATPKFEVASIKPCKEGDLPLGGRSGGRNSSPGTLRIDCTTAKSLINQAYVLFANGHVNFPAGASVEGGPVWINSERYQVDAKAEGPQSQGMMHGPMLQTLLEARFKLKIRRETREVPAYALIVAKGRPKLQPFKEGSCTPLDPKFLEQFPPQPFPDLPPGQEYCGGIDPEDGRRWVMASGTMKGPIETLYAAALSIDDFIKMSLSRRVGRPVINKTGLTGRFDYHLEFAPDETMPGFRDGELSGAPGAAASDPAGPSIFTALQQQLGLKLEPAKGLAEFFVIDSVERPSEN